MLISILLKNSLRDLIRYNIVALYYLVVQTPKVYVKRSSYYAYLYNFKVAIILLKKAIIIK